MGRTGPKNLPGSKSAKARALPGARPSRPSASPKLVRKPPARPPAGGGKVSDNGRAGVGKVRGFSTPHTTSKRGMPGVPSQKGGKAASKI